MDQGYTNTLKQGSAPEATGRRLFRVHFRKSTLTVARSALPSKTDIVSRIS